MFNLSVGIVQDWYSGFIPTFMRVESSKECHNNFEVVKSVQMLMRPCKFHTPFPVTDHGWAQPLSRVWVEYCQEWGLKVILSEVWFLDWSLIVIVRFPIIPLSTSLPSICSDNWSPVMFPFAWISYSIIGQPLHCLEKWGNGKNMTEGT